MTNPRLKRFTSWLAAVLLALSFSVLTGACVFQEDDDGVDQVETEDGTEEEETEVEVEVEDEETP